MQLASLFVKVGLNGQDSVISGLSKIKMSTAVAGVTVGALVTQFTRMTEKAVQTAMALDQYATFTGKSSQELQKLSFELGQTGVGMGELQGTLQALEKQRTDMLLGRGYNPAFVLLGIDPRTDPVKILEELRDRIGKIQDPNIAKALANQLGISDKLFYSLTKNNRELDTFGNKLLITDKERNSLVKLNREWRTFLLYLEAIENKIIAIMADSWLADLASEVINIVRFLGDIGAKIDEFANKNPILKAFYEALKLVFKPLELVPEIVLHVLGAFEDLFAFLDGKDSLIGRMLAPAKEGLKTIVGYVKDLWKLLKNSFEIFGKLGELWKNLKGGKLGENSFSQSLGVGGMDLDMQRLAPAEGMLEMNSNSNVSINNYNTFNGYSPDELKPELVNITEKDVSDAQMVSPENSGGF